MMTVLVVVVSFEMTGIEETTGTATQDALDWLLGRASCKEPNFHSSTRVGNLGGQDNSRDIC